MGRELWEIVRADELQPDNTIRLDIYSHVIHVDRIIRGGGLVEIYPSKDLLSHRQPVLRRVDPADDPRVLRRALEHLYDFAQVYAGHVTLVPLGARIDQARRELESEGRE